MQCRHILFCFVVTQLFFTIHLIYTRYTVYNHHVIAPIIKFGNLDLKHQKINEVDIFMQPLKAQIEIRFKELYIVHVNT